jgi:Domain of unknown function (DUF4384)
MFKIDKNKRMLFVAGIFVSFSAFSGSSELLLQPVFLEENPCIGNTACDYEAVEVQAPAAEYAFAFLDSRSKSISACLTPSAPACTGVKTTTVKTVKKIVYRKKVTTTVTTVASSAPTVVTLPVAGQVIAPSRYEALRFSWRHTNGRPVHRDHKFRTGDVVDLAFESAKPGHLHVVNIDSAGTVIPLFPRTQMGERSEMTAGRRQIKVNFEGLTGVERVYAIFTDAPIQNSINQTAVTIHKQFLSSNSQNFQTQYASFNENSQISPYGVIVSQAGETRSKGLAVLSTNFEANSNSPSVEAAGAIVIDPVQTLAHRVHVLSLDLIHVSP